MLLSSPATMFFWKKTSLVGSAYCDPLDFFLPARLHRFHEFRVARLPIVTADIVELVAGLMKFEIFLSRTNEHGLFPKEQYCGDIATPVYSLNSNAKCWAALRDLVPVLKEIGENAEADRIAAMAAEFHKNILAGLDKSI